MTTKKLAGRGGPNRGQGRKPNTAKGMAQGRTVTITVKVSPAVYERLNRLAHNQEQSLSTCCAMILSLASIRWNERESMK